MENDLGPPAEDAMMTSEKRIEIGTTWPSYHSHSLQSADINANQALQQACSSPALAGLTRQTFISTTAGPSEYNFLERAFFKFKWLHSHLSRKILNGFRFEKGIILFKISLYHWIPTALLPSPPPRRAISALMKNPAFYSLALSANTKVEACRW